MSRLTGFARGLASAIILYGCGQPHAQAPVAVYTEQRIAPVRPLPLRDPPTQAAPDYGKNPSGSTCEDYRAPALRRHFRVELSGEERIAVHPWFVKGLPPPAKLDDLNPWSKEWNRRDVARLDQTYSLEIRGDVTLREFSAATDIFASRGLVHPVVAAGGTDVDFYAGYVPAEAARPVDTSLATLNIVIEDDTVYLTSVMMLNQWKHELIADQQFALATLHQGCTGEIASYLLNVCGHQRWPCDRILFGGMSKALIAPFLETLALVRRVVPNRVPGVIARPTPKAGNAARSRDRGCFEFLEFEDLIEPVEDSTHP